MTDSDGETQAALPDLDGDTLAAGLADSSPDADIALVSPEQRYTFRRPLGEGGMGEILLCRDRVIGRDVAMKVVLPEHAAHGEMRRRFVREARVQGQLEHPAIVPVYDFAVDQNGRPFFTMMRVRGVTLETVLEKLREKDPEVTREYTRHRLLAAFVRVCLVVDFAHEHGVLNRDLKPANVMLGRHGEVYVLDWGLAKLRTREADSRPDKAESDPAVRIDALSKTAVGAVLGTPAYMAPEQIRGEDTDLRTDIYSLGAILFELLSLQPLHGPGTANQMMARVLAGIDARPSQHDRDIAPELDAICVAACARLRVARPETARSVAEAVEAFLSGDRDVALRARLAGEHLERARSAAATKMTSEGSSAGGADELTVRASALREVGRALALSPEDQEARELLLRLLTEPPAVAPPEVNAAIVATKRATMRTSMRRGAFMYASAIIFIPVQAACGIRNWLHLLAPVVCWLLSASLCAYAYTKGKHLELCRRGIVVFSVLALAGTSLAYGPLLMMPLLVCVNAMATMLTSPEKRRPYSVAAFAATIVLPIVLVWTGHHRVVHVFDGESTLTIVTHAIAMPRGLTLASLAAGYILVMFIAIRFATQHRDAALDAVVEREMHAWQLRQLVAPESRR